MGLRVEEARSAADHERIQRFRYRVYVEEMGIATPDADPARRTLSDPLDDHATCWALLDGDDEVVGTLRSLVIADLPEPDAIVARYQMEPALRSFDAKAIALSGRFMLDARLRGGKAVLRLMTGAFETSRERGVRIAYGDCSPHLLPMYEHLGFRCYGRAFNDPSYGFKVPILLILGGRERFEQVRSPLRRIARDGEDLEAVAWFERSYPEQAEFEAASLLPEGVFLDLLWERVARSPLHALGVLRDLTREEADRFLSEATVVSARDGDVLVRQGERGDSVFVLLSGGAEVHLDEAPDRPLGWLGAGDSFGEMAFLTESARTASVVARGDCEAVVLSGQFLRNLVERQPRIAAKVALNLSRELAGRLTAMNRRAVGR